MKKYLLSNTNSYKANLHCHTNVSDGFWSPEKMKEEYLKRGYSIVAYTDHNMMIDHHKELSDEKFLALRGFEVQIAELPNETPVQRSCHICAIALDPDNLVQPCFNQKSLNYWKLLEKPASDLVIYDKDAPDYEYYYDAEMISRFMKDCRDAGFFMTYNHPSWGMETAKEFTNYHNMHAMEMCNFGCYEAGYEDYNPYIYDQILRGGERIFCTANDDNHNLGENPYHDSFGAFTIIRADELEYRTITRAMENGDMYASQGPIINELYVEDGMIHITSSTAKRIYIGTGKRYSRCIWAKDGEELTSASFKIPEKCNYIRVTVEDPEGRHANTRAYFEDEL